MPLDHIGYYVPASLLETEVRFLLASLAHLGVAEFKRPHPSVVGLGPPRDPYLWVAAAEAAPASSSSPDSASAAASAAAAAGLMSHVAIKAGSELPLPPSPALSSSLPTIPFSPVLLWSEVCRLKPKSTDRAEVDAFHAAALAAGGQDNGKPGDRTEYHAGYYAAFVRSPAGVNLEVVFHDMEALKG